MPPPAKPCPACGYDLAGGSAAHPCPECGTPFNEGRVQRYRRIDRRRSLRIYAAVMIPAWVFLIVNVAGYGTAFWILKLPRGVTVYGGQHPVIDRLALAHLLAMLALPASAIGLLVSPFLLYPAVRRFREDDNPKRLAVLAVLTLPALTLALMIVLEPAPATLFAWLPE